MNRIQIYIFGRALKAFVLTLAVLVGVIWLTQALEQLDLMTNKGQSFTLFLQITWLVLPKFLSFIAPIAVLVATIYTLNSLNNDSELVIMTNSGAKPFSILKPLLVLASLVMIADSAVAHYFSPNSRQQLRAFFTEVNSDLISSIIKPGEFANINDGITFYVGSRDGNGIFKDVFVSDNRDETQSLTYLANLGAITRTSEGTFFVLQNGTIHRRPKDRDSISIIDYSSYAFDLSTFQRAIPDELKFKKPSENFTPYLFKVDPKNVAFVRAPAKFFSELHGRFAEPLYSISYVLIAFFFLGRAETTRQGLGLSILSTFLCVFALRACGFAAQSIASDYPGINFIQYVLPIGAIILCTVLILLNIEPRILRRATRRLEDIMKNIKERSVRKQASNQGGV
ncbi:MAG: LPS export ABC transporter permease LptF [Hyphomicrobiales bacterium]